VYIPVENELELRLGDLPVLMWDSPTRRQLGVFKFIFYLIIYLIDSSLGSIVFVGQRHFWIDAWTQLGTETGGCITDMGPAWLSCLRRGQHQRAEV